MKRPALLIPAYGLAALGTAATYLHVSVGIVAGFDGIAKGRYFLGPVLSISPEVKGAYVPVCISVAPKNNAGADANPFMQGRSRGRRKKSVPETSDQ